MWYTALSRMERSIVDLTIKCVKRVQSTALADALIAITNKLLNTLEETFPAKADKLGREIAQKICEIAQKWGNKKAWTWEHDTNFIRFAGVNTLNSTSF